MPGMVGRPLWSWEKPPIYVIVIFCLAWVEFAGSWVLSETLPRWSQSVPDALHPIELKQGGHFYYLSPGLAWFLSNDLWIFFGLLGILGLTMIIHHDKIERVR